MMAWVAALALAGVTVWIAYQRESREGSRVPLWLLMGLRAAAVALVAAMVFDAPSGAARSAAPLVAIDASASWRRGSGDEDRRLQQLHAFWDSVARGAPDDESVVVFGDSVRVIGRGALSSLRPSDAATHVRPVIDRAAAAGRPLVLVTDGVVDEPEALADAPPGSRAVVPVAASRADVGLADLSVQAAAQAGDTLPVAVLLAAGPTGAPPGIVALRLDATEVVQVATPPLAAWSTTRLTAAVPLPRGARTSVLEAVLQVAGDLEPRNDTLRAAIDVTDRPAAIFVSTAPDLDVREVLTVMRGALAIPTRAYLRVAPGQWREEGTFTPLREDDVHARARAAGMLIVHGDSLWEPSNGTIQQRQARAIWTPAPPTPIARAGEIARAAEWFPVGTPPSPMAAALAGVPWDSVPPVTIAGPVRSGDPVLTVQQGRRGESVAAITATEVRSVRTVRVSGSGFAGWALRGGRSAQAFTALWGALFDWLSSGRGDVRAARPAAAWVRAGDPVRWQRGAQDSLVTVTVRPRPGAVSTAARETSTQVRLHFGAGSTEATSAALPPGVYDVQCAGGASVLVVNASREWVPSAPLVQAGPLRGGSLKGVVPRLRDAWWPFAAAMLMLCAEWVARRGRGLR